MNKIIELEECESTNNEAWKRFNGRDTVIVTSLHQTAGRGRLGRHWVNPIFAKNNLLISIATKAPLKDAHWTGLAASLAAFDSVQQALHEFRITPPGKLRLKWPNDLCIGEMKCGGLLCESKINGESMQGVVIGFGLNICFAPQTGLLEGLQACSLTHLEDARTLELRAFIRDLFISQIEKRLAELSSLGFAHIRTEWKKRAYLNEFPVVRTHDDEGKLKLIPIKDLNDSGEII